MLKKILLTSFLVLLAMPAFAQGGGIPCGDTAGIHSHLSENYGESTIWYGLNQMGDMVEIVANGETGTWTLLLNKPGGITCLMNDGHGSSVMEPTTTIPLPGNPS